jgi:transposase
MRSSTWSAAASCRQLPAGFPPATTVYDVFRGWVDFETRPEHHEAMFYIAMVMTMSRRLAQ